MTMTLEQVRDWHRELSSVRKKHPVFAAQAKKHADMADAIDAHLTQPAQSVDVAEAIRKGFMTAESCGPDNRYVLSIKFGSLDDLQAAHNALVGLTAALQEKGNG